MQSRKSSNERSKRVFNETENILVFIIATWRKMFETEKLNSGELI